MRLKKTTATTISATGSNITAPEATNAPTTACHGSYPAFITAVYPVYVAVLIPTGPGVIWLTANISVNSCGVSHLWFTVTSFCIKAIMA